MTGEQYAWMVASVVFIMIALSIALRIVNSAIVETKQQLLDLDKDDKDGG